jgi:heptosyltransferase-2
MARIPLRIGFSTSAGRSLLTTSVRYDPDAHEIDRNLALLAPLGVPPPVRELPTLSPGREDAAAVDTFLLASAGASLGSRPMVALAPGSVWPTKRWPAERYAAVARALIDDGCLPVLVGGEEDNVLCSDIAASLTGRQCLNAAGRLSLLGSAELLRRCVLTVSNDSAPMHLSVAVRTPVIARFGFAPSGSQDEVVESDNLPCRPCSIHGGYRCPIQTFDCMLRITPDRVIQNIRRVVHGAHRPS